MITLPLKNFLKEEEDYKLFEKAFKQALLTNQKSFRFKDNFYMTKFVKELIMNNNSKKWEK